MQGVWGESGQMNPSRMRKTVGGVALSFVLAVVIGISGVIAPGGGAALGASTTLTILGGEVQVSRNGGAFTPAADGAIIGPGDVIRTAADARAVLTYFEGSTVSVEPSSELAIDEASSNPDGSTVVVMTQNLGRTWHVVTKLITGGSRYEVRTPAATASVRGTEFAVGVGRDARGNSVTDVVTTGGAVSVAAPATVADPQPEPVLVPTGFRTTTTTAERKPQAPTIAPEPERKVTVTIGSANALVVDPLGRSNGYKDGKLVLQTPGAQVVRTAGTLLITLPDIPDGKISTVVARAADAGSSGADIPVITNVQERGKSSTLVEDTVKPTEIATGLELKASGAGPQATPEVRRLTEDEEKDLNTGKVVAAPKVEARRAAARPGLGSDPAVIAKIVDERRGEPAGGATSGSSGSTGAGSGSGSTAGSATEASNADAPAPAAEEPRFVQPLPFQGAPSAANQQREEAKRQDASNRIEAEIKGSEQLQKAAETATKVAESAQIVAESGQQRATEDKTRHEQQLKAAEEAARTAQRRLLEATDTAKTKEAEEAVRQAEAQKQAFEAARRRAEIEAKQKADEAARADAARRAAAEVAERARLDTERLRQEQQQKQQQGGGNSGGGNSGSPGGGNKGSGKSEESTPGGGGVKLPDLPRPGKP